MSEKQDQETEQQTKGERKQQIEREKEDIMARVGSSEISTLRHRVAWLMNRFPSTRRCRSPDQILGNVRQSSRQPRGLE